METGRSGKASDTEMSKDVFIFLSKHSCTLISIILPDIAEMINMFISSKTLNDKRTCENDEPVFAWEVIASCLVLCNLLNVLKFN